MAPSDGVLLEARGLRAGFGLAIEAHSQSSFAVEASLGSSIDGGLFFNLSFNPVYDIQLASCQ